MALLEVVRVLLEHELLLDLPVDQHEGPGAERGIVEIAVLLDAGLADDEAPEAAERGEEARERLLGGELDRVLPDRLDLAFCFEAFPRLAERRRQLAGSMSGGEQQMLALGRALMTAPRILLVDEPSVGLAPVLVSLTIDKIKELKERYQLTVLMAEQNFPQALRIADRGYVIVHGKIAFEGKSADELNNNDLIRKFYLGL